MRRQEPGARRCSNPPRYEEQGRGQAASHFFVNVFEQFEGEGTADSSNSWMRVVAIPASPRAVTRSPSAQPKVVGPEVISGTSGSPSLSSSVNSPQ